MISTLTYVSTLHGSVGQSELDSLLASSRTRNAEVGITGLMLVRDRRVMQILEGEEAQVRSLYARIRQDPRHHDVTRVWTSSSSDRRFPTWSMGYEDLQDADGGSIGAMPGMSDGRSGDGRQVQLDREQRTFLNRRVVLLRRGLANGNRLVSALAIILDAHDAQLIVNPSSSMRCRQGCITDDGDEASYPCPTAENAFWALDATL